MSGAPLALTVPVLGYDVAPRELLAALVLIGVVGALIVGALVLPWSFRARLALVAAAGLAVRVGFVYLARPGGALPDADPRYYVEQGRLLAQLEGWFLEPFFYDFDPPIRAPGGHHPPLYSMFFMVAWWLGVQTVFTQRIASGALGVVAVVLVGLVGRRLGGERAGIIGAALAAVYGNLWLNDVGLGAESLLAVTVAWLLLAAYRFWERPTAARAVWVGVAIAACTLTRAEAVAYFALVMAPLVLAVRALRLSERVRLLAVGGAVGVLLLLPWVAFNVARFEEPTYLSTGLGFTLMLGSCDAAYDQSSPLVGYWTFLCDDVAEPPGVYDQSVSDELYRQAGLAYIRDHLHEYPRVFAVRVLRVLDLFRPSQNVDLNAWVEARGVWPGRWALAQWWAMLPAAGVGLWALRRRKLPTSPFVGLFLGLVLTMAVSFGITRFRVPLDVAACVLAGVGVDAVLRRWWDPRRRARALRSGEGLDGLGRPTTPAGPAPREASTAPSSAA